MHNKVGRPIYFMRIIKILFFQSVVLTFLLVGFNAFAADLSICDSGAKIILYADGSLQNCLLKNDFEVNRIKCKSDAPVHFYNNGSLESCLLAKSISIGMMQCQQDGLISFFIGGNLKSCMKPGN